MRPQTVPAAVGDDRTTPTQASVRSFSKSPWGSIAQTPCLDETGKQDNRETRETCSEHVDVNVNILATASRWR